MRKNCIKVASAIFCLKNNVNATESTKSQQPSLTPVSDEAKVSQMAETIAQENPNADITFNTEPTTVTNQNESESIVDESMAISSSVE